MKVGMLTLGCAKNTVDSEIMLAEVLKAGYEITEEADEAEILIVNTCGFIQAAKEESIEALFEMAALKQSGRARLVIATGCLAQRYGETILADMPEVDAIIGTGSLHLLPEAIERALEGKRPLLIDPQGFDYDAELGRQPLTPAYSAYLKIAEGCNHRCSYCAIPLIRGPYRSRSQAGILRDARRLARSGVKEINIIAQDITYYGRDLSGRFQLTELLTELLKIEGPAWYRLLYLYPTHFTDDLLKLMVAEPRLLSYVDLPLQHISPKILKAMRRPDSPEQIRRLVTRLREVLPDLTLRTTFITGFPGETDADVELLADFMQETAFDHVGIFSYSREEGTESHGFEAQVPRDVAEARRDYLLSLQAPISRQRNERYIGQTIQVLVEEEWSDGKGIIGRGKKDAPEVDGLVYVEASSAVPGELISVQITDAFEYDLVGVAKP